MSQSGEMPFDISPYIDGPVQHTAVGDMELPFQRVIISPIEEWRRQVFIKTVVEQTVIAGSDSRMDAQYRFGAEDAAARASEYSVAMQRSKLTPQEISLIALIGTERYVAISRQAPPQELINHMITNPDRYRHRMRTITIAVLKGAIAWDERFAAAGAPEPDQIINEQSEGYEQSMYRRKIWFGRYDPRSWREFWYGVGSYMRPSHIRLVPRAWHGEETPVDAPNQLTNPGMYYPSLMGSLWRRMRSSMIARQHTS